MVRRKAQEQYAPQTARVYFEWIKRYVHFSYNGKRIALHAGDERHFHAFLATLRNRSASTRSQALAALTFFYRDVLQVQSGWLRAARERKSSQNTPAVITVEEAERLINLLASPYDLMAGLMYGAGLRVQETVRLRIRDIDFAHHQLRIPDPQTGATRTTLLPQVLVTPMQAHMNRLQAHFESARHKQPHRVPLPSWLPVQHPRDGHSWLWQWFFPSPRRKVHTTSDALGTHVREQALARAVAAATDNRWSPQTLRHAYIVRLLEAGYDMRSIQAVTGYKSMARINRLGQLVYHARPSLRSPLDDLPQLHWPMLTRYTLGSQ